MKNTITRRMKTMLIIGTIGLVGGIGIAAGDNYFEISKNIEVFTEVYKELNIYYVDDVNPGEIMKTGIDAMLTSLDPYTDYIPESDIEEYRFQTTGQYGGIGALIKTQGDKVMVSEPYETFPAATAGFRAGDEIISVDGKKVSGMDTEQASKLLKGQAGTNVKIVTRRAGVEQEHTLTRMEIKIPDVPYKGFVDETNKVGYVKLNGFTATAGTDVRNAIKELKDQGMQKLVLDLRGNGGGLLREAVNIVNLFVPKNEKVVETKGRIAEWDKSYTTLSEPLDANVPLVVIVDEGSASASEIVAGALQDLDRAVILGERTYGKGLVQQTRDIVYNNKVKVTVAKYYIPSGRCIQKIDYAHRDSSGTAVNVSDSAIKAFETRNGRPVFDGRGIAPDVTITEPDLAKVVGGLAVKDLFFDYANKYRATHDSIGKPETFVITDAIYEDFLTFVKDKEFTYDTESLDALDELVAAAKKERYYEHSEKAIEALKAELKPNKEEELRRFRDDVSEVLRGEIVSRYMLQTGRYRAALATDPYLKRALEVLNTGETTTILSGKK
ncbi:MAG: S41 family peptidase [Flavobacteriales bacterium]|nr:S41 family peptidase [Flavobacteriales bacterium]MBP6572931.1 S41 family peptidase [Flavobacteriales bacterium]